MKPCIQRTPSSSIYLRVATIALGALGLWPTVASAGRAEGTSDSLGNQARATYQPNTPLPFVPYKDATMGWDPNPVVMPLLCAFDANVLQTSCENGSFACGGMSIPCGPYYGGVETLAAGIGLRNFRRGNIPVRAARQDSQAVFGMLIWSVIDRIDDNGEQRGANIGFNDSEFTGTLLGESHEPCWQPVPDEEDPDGSVPDSTPTVLRTYIADVTDYLYDQINGDYPVTLDGASLVNGEAPWGSLPSQEDGFMAEGASLVVVAAHPSISPEALVAFHAQPTFLLGHEEFHHELTLPVPDGNLVQHTRIAADGQTRAGNQLVAGYNTLFGPSTHLWVPLRGDDSEIDTHRDWQGLDGGYAIQLWDTATTATDLLQLGLPVGATSYRIRYETELTPNNAAVQYDCVNVLAHILSIQ